MHTKGLLKAHISMEIVGRSKYMVFPTNDGKFAVAYHLAGSLWNVVGDPPTNALAQELCKQLNQQAPKVI